MLPMKWEAMRRGTEFCVHVMRMGEGRNLKELEVMSEALKLEDRVKWVKDLQLCLERFG